MLYHLAAGMHTLTIVNREDGTKIDKILIANHSNRLPVNTMDRVTLLLEAENGDIVAPMEIVNADTASGGSYIWTPEGAGKNSDPLNASGYARYAFMIPTEGDYTIWGLVISNDIASDSFYISVDDNEFVTWHTKEGGVDTWTWDVVSAREVDQERNDSNPMLYHLAAGMHTLTIVNREDGTKIDKIQITNENI